MKKLSLVFVVLFVTFSFGQTKKEETKVKPSLVKEDNTTRNIGNVIEGHVDFDSTIEQSSSSLIEGDTDKDDNTIYSTAGIELKPKFPGGKTKMNEFINKNFIVPEINGAKIEGKVFVNFIVEKDGSLSDIKIVMGEGYDTAKEAKRVLKMMPRWKPAKQKGLIVRCSYSMWIDLPLQILPDKLNDFYEPPGIGYSPSNDDNLIYNLPGLEVKPEFPGGIEKLNVFLSKNYKMPNEEGLEGKVYVAFEVEKDGSLTHIKIIRDIGYGTGAEAIRVFKMMPKWSPAKHNGKKVRCAYTLPIILPIQ